MQADYAVSQAVPCLPSPAGMRTGKGISQTAGSTVIAVPGKQSFRTKINVLSAPSTARHPQCQQALPPVQGRESSIVGSQAVAIPALPVQEV